jgi:hypothetical protein
MNADGSRVLAERIAQHQHWLQAEAVRAGSQTDVDPDADELEEMYDGVRVYGRETHQTTVDGRTRVVTQRLVKRLVAGYWEASLERDQTDPVARG